MIPEEPVQSSRVAARNGQITIQLPLLPQALPAADKLLVIMLLCVSEFDRCRSSAARPPVGPESGFAGSFEPRRVLANGDTAPSPARIPRTTHPTHAR